MKIPRISGLWQGCVFGLAAGATLPANAARLGDLVYDNIGTEIVITGYTGSEAELTIPDTIDGLLVTEIDVAAFAGNQTLTRVELPKDLLFIRNRAFQGCTALTAMTIPGGVFEINDQAFEDCVNLSSLTIEDGVVFLFPSSFRNTAIDLLVVPASVDSIEQSAFAGTPFSLECYFRGDAPSLLETGGLGDPSGVFFFDGAAGFDAPSWEYAAGESVAAASLGELTNAKAWVLDEYEQAARLLRDDRAAPRPIFASYALAIDPQSGFAPETRIDPDGAFTIRYFAGRSDAEYEPLFSTGLESFSGEGVTVSPPDADGFREATSAGGGSRQFARIQVRER